MPSPNAHASQTTAPDPPTYSARPRGSYDTIAAISTPPGRGGIGIVRLTGPEAFAIATALLRLSAPLEHARARFGRVLDPNAAELQKDPPPQNQAQPAADNFIDEAVVTGFRGPQSYTGDDVVEIATHGAPVVLDTVLTAALRHGARLAEPGEFTQRAFLAGRLDLTQAEAVHDLIAAQTLEQARAAAQQLGGALSRRLAPAKERLLHLIALLEAGMDFASGELDDVEVVSPAHIAAELAAVYHSLGQLAQSFHAGALLRSGVSLALVGRPNAGKSSLFNHLLERPRAIVTPLPGTTRDTVEETWSLGGIPIRLVDTAGLRLASESTADEAERLGIERSREALAEADLILLVRDATEPITPEERTLEHQLTGRPLILIRNKVDLLPHLRPEPAPEPPTKLPAANDTAIPPTTVSVSALTGEGLAHLKQILLDTLHAGSGPLEGGALTNRRQHEHLLAALAALEAAQAANHATLPHEALLLDLHTALRALDTLTGQTTADDILARIFSTFCIGK